MSRATHKSGQQLRGMLASVVLIAGGMAGVVLVAHWWDAHQPPSNAQVEEERLYLTGNSVRRLSLGFNGLVADWYWMRSLQYVGRKILSLGENVQLDSLGQLDLRLLAPLLDATTTLDPEFMEPYQYAAVVLPDIDVEQAKRILTKGIAANPMAWRLHHYLGYIHWQHGNFQAASDEYARGASIPGAPPWMEAMKARMAAEGGSRDVAREIYRRMYEQGDSQVRDMARLRLLQLDSLDARDGLRKVLLFYKERTGRCPSSWSEVEPILRSVRVPVDHNSAPLDPTGTAYVLIPEKCEVDLDPNSDVPYK